MRKHSQIALNFKFMYKFGIIFLVSKEQFIRTDMLCQNLK